MLIDKFIQYIKKYEPEFVPSLIMDIGSRDLDQSLEFNSVWPKTHIYAFEPTPTQFEICESKVGSKKDTIKVFNLALGNSTGMVDFWVTSGNIGCSSVLEPIHVPFGSQDKKKISVPLTTPSKILSDSGDDISNIIVWMDVQGYELAVLEGFESFIKNVKYIHLEAAKIAYYKGHSSKESIEKFLSDNGFEYEFYEASGHPFGEGDIIARRK